MRPEKPTPKTDALYCRVSTEIQLERGESIENQQERLLQYAQEHSLSPELYVDAGISAKDTNRPQLQRLIADIKAGKIRTVLVTKLDRISRSVKDIIDLTMLFEEHGVAFKSLSQPFDTSSAMGRAQINLMSMFAQLEREMTSERVGEDMRHRARSGKWNGGVVPFGYMAQSQQIRLNLKNGMSQDEAEKKAKEVCSEDKKLYVHREEAKLVREIFNKYIETESLRSVTHWLNARKIPSRFGTTWAANSVSRLLKSPIYIGQLVYNKRVSSKSTGKLRSRPKEDWIIAEAQHEPIVDKVNFDRVQFTLEKQSVEPTRKMSEYLLSGLLKCGLCGHSMHGYTYRKGNGKDYSYYKCSGQQQKGESVCKSQAVSRPEIDELVEIAIINLLKGKELVDLRKAHEMYERELQQDLNPAKAERDKLIKRNDEIQRKKKVLLEKLEDETIKSYEYKERAKELDSELEQNKLRIYSLDSKVNDLSVDSLSFQAVMDILKNFKSLWKNADILGRKAILNSIVSKIIYTDHKTPVELELFFLGDVCLRTGTHRRTNLEKKGFLYKLAITFLPKKGKKLIEVGTS